MKKGMKGISALMLALLLAAVSMAYQVAAQNYEILSKDKSPEEIVSALKERLQLTEEQEQEIRSIIEDDFKKLNDLKEKYSEDNSTDELSLLIEVRRLRKETEDRIEAVLTEEQMEGYRKLQGEYLAKVQREARNKITDDWILEMKERLDLTEEQADLVLPILDEARKQRQAMMEKFRGQGRGGMGPGGVGRGDMSAMREMREEMQRLDEQTEQRLAKILTEKQMDEYRKIKKEQRERMRERMRGEMGRRPGGGRGGR